MDSGVYKIENQVNGKVYIGSTKNFERRWNRDHRCNLRNNIHENEYLQRSWNKYGSENFEFRIVVKVQESYMIKAEQYWIDYYESYKEENGYNLNPKAHKFHRTEEMLQKMADNKKYKKENNPNWNGGKVSTECNECGKEYKLFPSQEDTNKYCSTECRRKNMPSGEDNPKSKLTKNSVRKIKRLLKNTDKTHEEISNLFNVSSSTIYRIKSGGSWSNVKL